MPQPIATLLYLLSNHRDYALTPAHTSLLASFLPRVSKTLLEAWALHQQRSLPSASPFSALSRRRKGPTRRVVLTALYFRDGVSMRELADEHGVPRSTLCRRVNAVVDRLRLASAPALTMDDFLALSSQKKRGLAPKTTGKKTPEILEHLRGLAVADKTSSDPLVAYRNELVRTFPSLGGKLSVSSVCRWLKHDLRISLKKATSTALAVLRPENVEKRDTVARKWFDGLVVDADGHVVYTRKAMRKWRLKPEFDLRMFHALDESGFNTTTGIPGKARAPIGEPAYVTRRHGRSINHSLLPVLSCTGGIVASHYKPGGYTRDALLAFFATKYIPAVAEYRRSLPEELRNETIHLIMDNFSAHHGSHVEMMLASANVKPLFIPPYTPLLNPCELVFSEIKRALRNEHYTDWNPRDSMKKQCAALKDRVLGRMATVSQANICGYYRCCGWRQPVA